MRRLAALIMLALLLVPAPAVAQATEPVGTVSEDDTTVSRAYDNPAAFVDDLTGVFALGFINATESQAKGMVNRFPEILAASVSDEGDAGIESGEMTPVPVSLGDEARGGLLPLTISGIDGEYAILVTRQGAWVQALVGFGIGEIDTMTHLEEIARATLPRWPSEEPIAVRADGLRAGGIWTTMPLPEDLPAGFEIDREFEEGPAATSGAGATAPPAPGATPASPDRDLPLLPTPTPVGDESPSGPATPGPPPVETATPAPNPRLALPFDVTVEIFLPLDLATVNDDGSCEGTGLLDGLTADGSLTLRAATDGGASTSAPLADPGQVAFDRETEQEICYFRATLTDVPPRAEYTLLAGDSLLRQFAYDELAGASSVLVVIGGE